MTAERECDRQARALDEFVRAGHHATSVYGSEWGLPESAPHLRSVRDEWLLASLGPTRRVLEIGSGGGRWSRYFVGNVACAVLVDGTVASEVAIRASHDWSGFRFAVSHDGLLPGIADRSIDYVWSFDTFVHFHRELFDRYVAEIGRVLVPGGLLHLHHAMRWPELQEVNPQVFHYREPEDVARVLANAGMRLTGRRVEFRGGLGSLLTEAARSDRA